MSKEILRNNIKKIRDNISVQEKKENDEAIFNLIINSEEYQKSKNIFTYMSFGSEADTKKIIEHAINNGKKVYLPRVNGDIIEFYHIVNMNHLIKSQYGILEPDETCKKADDQEFSDEKEVMLVPGLVFDLKGNRIGYGSGYYDKYFSEHEERFIKIGLAYDYQVVFFIKADSHDMKMDYIATNTELIKC